MSDTKNEECELRISRARTYLGANLPFLGYLTLKLVPEEAPPHYGVRTIAVSADGALWYNSDWISAISDAELRGVLAHEVLHPALGAFTRCGPRDKKLWNDAHDYSINRILADFFSNRAGSVNAILPQGGLLDQRFNGMSAEEIYEVLSEESERNKSKGLAQDEEGDGDDDGEGNGEEDGKDQADNPKNRSFRHDCRHDLSRTPDGKKSNQGDKSSQQRLEDRWKADVVVAATLQEERQRGSIPAGIQIYLKGILEPKVSWSTIISQWIGEHAGNPDLTYLRPGRRSEAVGERLVGQKKALFPEVTVLWDTSGSMHGQEKLIFSEIAAICTELTLGIRIIIIDAAIHADVEDVQEAEDIAAHIKGGGGSDFCPAFARLEKERNNSVVLAFTDGYIGVPAVQPEMLKGVVWVLMPGCPPPAKWGQVLRLDADKNGKWE